VKPWFLISSNGKRTPWTSVWQGPMEVGELKVDNMRGNVMVLREKPCMEFPQPKNQTPLNIQPYYIVVN
jgi:hypothetical protein